MNIIEWSEALSVGNFEVDEQHKELIKIINEVGTVIRQKQKIMKKSFSMILLHGCLIGL